MKKIFLVVAVCAFARVAASQQFTWQSYTSLQSVHDIAIDAHGNYWTATSGGAYRVNLATRQYVVFRNINALSTIALNAVAADPISGIVVFGGLNGDLDFLSYADSDFLPSSGTWNHSLDINLDEARQSINKLMFFDSLLYIAADYGISTYDVKQFAFIATCKHLGAIPSESRALSMAIWNGTLYVGTELGAAYTPLSTANLADSAFWKNIPGLQGLLIKALAASPQYLYVSTPNGLEAWDGTTLFRISGPAGDSSANIISISAVGSTVYAATSNAVMQVNGLTSSYAPSTNLYGISTVMFDAATRNVLVGDSSSGMISLNGSTIQSFAPNSPGGNIFSEMAFDRNGVLWCASAVGYGSGSGIFSFDGTTWNNYSTSSAIGTLPSNQEQTISTDSLGNVWAGTYGDGLVRLTENGGTPTVTRYTHDNSPLSGINLGPADTTFIIVGGSAAGPKDVEWIVPFDPLVGAIHPHLIAYDPHASASGTFYPFVCPYTTYLEHCDVVIDIAGTKWIAPMPDFRINKGPGENPVGVLFFNEGSSLANTSDDVWGIVGTTAGLRSNDATTVAIDADGELWVGTTTGISIISNPEAAISAPSSLIIRTPYLSALNGDNAYISCILVDPLNNKWIGTIGNGLFVVSPDGSQQLAHFDHTNSPILDDQIFALTINNKTGVVYIGTKNGLSTVSATGLAQSVGSVLKIGPQPYLVPSTSPMFLYGVPQDAEVKIFSINGQMVRDYQPGDLNTLGSSGGWDGKDTNGNWVETGVYLIAYAQPDGTSQLKKFAVIHR